MVRHLKGSRCDPPRRVYRKATRSPIDAGRASDQMQHSWITETLSKLRIKRNIPNVIKDIYEKILIVKDQMLSP